ncbi:putative transcription factor WD40-like family [Helianthus anomalus]
MEVTVRGFSLSEVAVPLVCHGHSRPVVDLFYSCDSTPMLRNGETGDWIGTFEGHKGAVWSSCLDTHALRSASASVDRHYDMSCNVESASLEPKLGDKFIAGGEDMWIRLFDFNTSEEIGLPGVLLIPSFCSNTRLFRVLSTISSEFYSFGQIVFI